MAAPASKVSESKRGRTSDDSIKVAREGLGRFEALTSTSGAAKIVRFILRVAIELLSNFFADNDIRMYAEGQSVQ